MKKIIQYQVRESYGRRFEYVVNQADAAIIQRLTGHKTIDSITRELLRDLSGGAIDFQQVLN